MTTVVEKSIEVDVPVSTAYNQWTQFEEFPRFMGGVQEVRQLDDQRMHWVAQIAGVKREWDSRVLEQVPDQKVAWAATEGATNAGAVYFQPVGAGRTMVRLHLEYEPEGLVEKTGDKLNIVEKQAESDLEKFKSFIESRGAETGAWRGSVGEGHGVGTPGVAHAASSQGDSGKAGVSGTAVAAGAAAAGAAAAAGIAAAKHRTGDDEDRMPTTTTTETEYVVTDVEVVPDPAATTYPGGPVSEPNRPL
ncbi:ribosome-associated toxin RatA of RatAB toxin-antitoxin module [Micromonospora sp. A200]|nr:ribosome-associated toxin RatA of RatAB toxin-antitoxin module [Micromonospora sp. A200]